MGAELDRKQELSAECLLTIGTRLLLVLGHHWTLPQEVL